MKLQEVSVKKPVLRIAALSLTLVAFPASCGDNIVDPKLPAGAVQFTPPAHYATWWEMTKSCSGRSGSMESVTWYQIPADLFVLDGKSVSAYWSAGSNQIVLSSGVLDDGQVVRHEMLHALLGEKGHSREDFLQNCAGYVTCTTGCVTDAGPAPQVPSTVPRVSASALEVTMQITRNPPIGIGGIYTIKISARNPAPNTVFVNLPTIMQSEISFAYAITGPFGKSDRVIVHDFSSATFAAGETKVHVFELFADNQGTLPRHIFAGQYTATGAFGGHSAPSQFLQVH